jgi:hypothetical protein
MLRAVGARPTHFLSSPRKRYGIGASRHPREGGGPYDATARADVFIFEVGFRSRHSDLAVGVAAWAPDAEAFAKLHPHCVEDVPPTR